MKSTTRAKLVLVLIAGTLQWNLKAQTTPPVQGGFAATSSLTTGRNWHTATMLNDGTVLIAGGMGSYSSSTSALNTAELYDPATGTSSPTASNMNSAHAYHTATLLGDGTVLIAGGMDGSGLPTTSAELYNPTTKTFTALAGLNTSRDQHAATLLNNGTVLIAGGFEEFVGPLTSAEIYDPSTKTFTALTAPGSSLNDARYGLTATLLNNGQVLIVGGFALGSGEISTAELYDPVAQTFTYTTDVNGNQTTLNYPRFLHTATLLNGGTVLIAGGAENAGYAPVTTNTAEVYDPAAGTFTVTAGLLNTARCFHSASLLNNGMVLITGGQVDQYGTPTSDAELYDPVVQMFSYTADINGNQTSLVNPRAVQTSTLLSNGNVLIAGGQASSVIPAPDPSYLSVTATAELYQPTTLIPTNLISSITVTPVPANASIPVGATQKYIAAGTFDIGVIVTEQLASVTWSSTDLTGSNVAQVSNDAGNSGVALALSGGSATIAACTGTSCGSAILTTTKIIPMVTWTIPLAITYGTPLSATQLNAASAIQGTYAYSPSAGSVLSAGSQTLSVTFTPTNTAVYTTVTATVSLIVNKAAPTISWESLAAITYGTPLSSAQLNAIPSVPGTLSYSPASGTVLGVGNQTLSVTLIPADTTDYTTATATVMLTVAALVNQPAVITSGSSTTFTEGTAGSFTLTSIGSPVPAWSETGTLPTGVVFLDNGNGTAALSGVPATGTAATYSITFTASNGAGPAATQAFTLTVNAAAAITSGSSTTFTVGSPGWFTVSTSGVPAPALTETGSLPGGITFVDSGDGTATLSGTPLAGTAGAYPITFGASNGVGIAASQSFTLTVNQGPAITSGSATVLTVGAAGSFVVTTTGVPVPALTETGALPSGVTFIDNGNGTAMLSGTPAVGSGEVYPITISAANNVATTTQSFTLTVDQGIAITSGSTTTFTVASQGWFSVTATGFPSPSLSETGNLPAGVAFLDNGNGTATLSGTPSALTGGTYGFTITATNGGVTSDATQSFTLVVNQGAAITTGNSTTFTNGVQGTFTVSATGTPAPALTETGALPTGVTFADNGNGTATLTGTPAANAGGVYPITINAANGVGAATMQSFTLTVNQGLAITSTNGATFNPLAAGTFTVTATGSPTPALAEVGNLPSGVTFVDNGNGSATLSGIPAAGTGGIYGFTITATNGVSPNATQSFTLSIGQGPAITSANAVTFIVGSTATFTVTATGIPTPALRESGALPSGVSFDPTTGVLSGTPAAGAAGSYTVVFTAHNSVASDATESFTLTVGQAPAFVSVSSTKFGASASHSFTVVTTGFPAATISESGALPSGVTLLSSGNGTAVLAGTPALGSEGTYPITLMASNEVGVPATQNFTLTVYGQTGPVFTSPNHITAAAATTAQIVANGVAINTFTVTATGNPTPTLKLACPGGVAGATGPLGTISFTDHGNGTATWTFTGGTVPGTYPICFTAIGAGGVAGEVVQFVTVSVVPAKLPVFTSVGDATFTQETFDSFTVTTSGAPTPAIQATAIPSWLTITDNKNGTATLSGIAPPPPLIIPGLCPPSVTYCFKLNAIGYGGAAKAATQNFNVVVVPPGQSASVFTSPNHITAAAATTAQIVANGVAINTFTVTATGNPTPTLKLACPGGVAGATGPLGTISFTDHGNGTATWVFTGGTPGTYQVCFRAIGAGGVAGEVVQFVTVSVVPAKLPVFTSVGDATFTQGTFDSFTVTTSGAPTPAIQATAIPSWLTITDNKNGTATLSGIAPPPPLIIPGLCPPSVTYCFKLNAIGYGGAAKAATQNFNVVVVPPGQSASVFTSPNHITAAAATTAQIVANGVAINTFTVTATGNPTPKLTLLCPGGVAGLTGPLGTISFTDHGNGTATWVFTGGTPGTYQVCFRAIGAGGVAGEVVQFVTVSVVPAKLPVFTSVGDATFTQGTFGSFTVTTSGAPTPTIQATGIPSWLTITDNKNGTATLSGIASIPTILGLCPASGSNSYCFNLTATGYGGPAHAAIQAFTLLVVPAP